LILASASPRRAELLAEAGWSFEVRLPPLAEPVDRPAGTSPVAWAMALAFFKARSVAEGPAGGWVLGADTLVWCEGQVLGKPADEADARRMLELQARWPSDVITGVALVRCSARAGDCAAFRESCSVELPERARMGRLAFARSRVWMRDDPHERERYLASGEWRGKAGAYGIQDPVVGDRLVLRREGSFSNVVGLPVELVRRMLADCGVPV
jgi:septum formation protein